MFGLPGLLCDGDDCLRLMNLVPVVLTALLGLCFFGVTFKSKLLLVDVPLVRDLSGVLFLMRKCY